MSEVMGMQIRIKLDDLVTLLTTGRREKKDVVMRRYRLDDSDLGIITEALASGKWRVVAHGE